MTPPRILIVDDEEPNRTLLRDLLEEQGFETDEAVDGPQALQAVSLHPPDLILLDVMMPGLNGFEVCRHLKQQPETASIPVIMITALSERQERLMGIEAGANDFLNKPVDLEELSLRVRNALYAKDLYDQLRAEQQKSEELLLNTLPAPIAARLKQGETNIAELHPVATILVADLVGSSTLLDIVGAKQLVFLLNEIFSTFDVMTSALHLEKLKTLGDAYVVVGGIHSRCANPTRSVADLAVKMHRAVDQFNEQYNTSLRMRMGISTGPVVAGVIGRTRFAFDVWGYTVNLACGLQFAAAPGAIQVDESSYDRLKCYYPFSAPTTVNLKCRAGVVTRTLNFALTSYPARISPAAASIAGEPQTEIGLVPVSA